MKNKNTKKVLSAVAVLAVSATMAATALPFAACSSNLNKESSSSGGNVTTISTALGAAQSVSSGKTIWTDPAAERKGSDSTATGDYNNPYNVIDLLNGYAGEIQPGDTVLIKPTTYYLDQRIVISGSISGAYNAYITIRVATSADNENIVDGVATLDFSQLTFSSTNRGVQINGDFIYWYGVDICGAGDNGMYIGGDFNTVENCEFYNNRDTGLQLGRSDGGYTGISQWPSYNLIKNCTSHNNYDNETGGENADGFAAKLTIGYGNVFDGCIAYRNSDDGWDLYAYAENGNIGTVIMYNCVAYENGYLEMTRDNYNSLFPTFIANEKLYETNPEQYSSYLDYSENPYMTQLGDGNGFKLGGGANEGDVLMYNCLSFNNRLHGVTDNSNPGYIKLDGVTSYDNSAMIDANGKIVESVKNSESSANIDVARQTYSYNGLRNVLSAKSALANSSIGADAYRGTVYNSLLSSGTKTNVVKGSIEGDTNNAGGVTYTSQTDLLDAAEIFVKLPITKDSEGNYTYNEDGVEDAFDVANFGNASKTVFTDAGETAYKTVALKSDRAHLAYRNDDGSINMGGLLEISASGAAKIAELLGEGVTIGSKLDGEEWGDYEHFYADDFVNGTSALDNAVVGRTLEALVVNCDDSAVYQDFEVPVTMWGASIVWSTEDDDLLEIGTDTKTTNSNTQVISIIVSRPYDEDKTATLTATVTYGTVTETKNFTLNIKQGDPSLGTLSVLTQNGERIYDGGSVIIDQFSRYFEPETQVLNGLYPDSVKYLDSDVYEVSSSYMYATDRNSTFYPVSGFTPSKAGVFVITNTVTLGGDGTHAGDKASMSYTVYVASKAAQVDFAGNEATINVYLDGYTITGDVTSATGAIYAVSSATELTDITKDNIKTYAGVESSDFRANSISFKFSNPNNQSYYIYYALSNVNGQITSRGDAVEGEEDTYSGIYCVKITVLNIDDEDDFVTLATTGKLGDETPSQTVYLLTKDLDFTDNPYTMGSGTFYGVFNGNNHTISNLSTTSRGIFYKVKGGTIMNVRFTNLTINYTSGSSTNTGLVMLTTGGYFSNIAFVNASITGYSRVAALIGMVGESNYGANGYDLYISRVSISNNSDHEIIGTQAGNARAAGLIGYVQYYGYAITIDNCSVVTDIDVSAGHTAGGMVGAWQDTATDTLTITNCFYLGTITTTLSSTRGGGMLGYHSGGAGKLVIDSCLDLGTFIAGKGNEPLTEGLKNMGPIIGNYSLNADVSITNCYGLIAAYNSDYEISVLASYAITAEATYTALGWDFENVWSLVYENESEGTVKAPYLTIKWVEAGSNNA